MFLTHGIRSRATTFSLAVAISAASVADAQARPQPAAQRPAALTARQRDAIMATRDSLMRFFKYEEDLILGGGRFTHRDFLPSNRFRDSYLDLPVDHRGRAALRSNYHGREWIFHDRLVARVGTRVITTVKVPSYEISRDNSSSGVWETFSITAARDGGLLRAIVLAPDSAPLPIVRLLGEYSYEFTMEASDRVAIRQAHQLASALRQVGMRPRAVADSVLMIADANFGVYCSAGSNRVKSIPRDSRRAFIGRRAAEAAGFALDSLGACGQDPSPNGNTPD